MRPDQRWFPTSRNERAAWFQNFTTQFANVGVRLGFTQADIDSVAADNAVVQYLKGSARATETFAAAMTSFQKTMLLGKAGRPASGFPAFHPPAEPAAVPAGIFERLENLVRRLRCAPGYNAEYGALFGIVPRNARRPAANFAMPKFRIMPDGDAYTFKVKATKGLFTGFIVYYQRQNSLEWETAGTFYRSPGNITIVPLNEGSPEVISVRVRMLQDNDPIGEYSPIQTVILAP